MRNSYLFFRLENLLKNLVDKEDFDIVRMVNIIKMKIAEIKDKVN